MTEKMLLSFGNRERQSVEARERAHINRRGSAMAVSGDVANHLQRCALLQLTGGETMAEKMDA